MVDNVSFPSIPDDIRIPFQATEISNRRADGGTAIMPHKIVLVGQKLAAAPIAVNTETVVQDADQVAQLCGRGSMLHQIALEAKRANPYSEMTLIAAADLEAGVVAEGGIVFTGPATASGTMALHLDGTRIQIGVTKGDTAAAIATNAAAQINAELDLPATAAVDGAQTSKVIITARHKGECGNDIDIRFNANRGEALPAGVTVAITPMTGGTGNPDVGPLLAAIKGNARLRLVMPWNDEVNLDAVEADFEERFGPMRKQEAHAFACQSGTFGDLTTFGDGRNSPHSTVFWREGNMVSPWRLAARACGLITTRGASDPARPYHAMPLTGIPAPAEGDRGDNNDHNALLKKGISTFKYGPDGSTMIEMVCTTYKTNSFGMPTTSYFKLQSKWGADYFRFRWDALIAQEYPDFKLADDGTDYEDGQPIVTPSILKARAIGLFIDLERAGQVENRAAFKQSIVMLRSMVNKNQVNSVMAPDLVNQYDVQATLIEFIN
jgi:phage tail sheath gpL-like